MGVDSKKAPPLPAPTEESESTVTQTDLATDVSRPAADDDKSHYSLPEDGTPVTIKTRGHQSNKSQTSLLIEYFEGGKPTTVSTSSSGDRKPSVRVRLTPSKHRKNDHIQITETKSSSRKASFTRRQSPLTPTAIRSQEALSVRSSGDLEDGKSMSSYASATEESNVSRNPIEVEIDSGGHRRRRRPASPLIPAADSSKASYQPGNMSDISAIPTDSFLDGSDPSNKTGDGRRSRSRSEIKEKERIVLPKSSKEREKSQRRHKSKSRTSSASEHRSEEGKSGRRRSSKTHDESVVSAADSSTLSSALTPSHRSYDASSMRSGASRSSINNPKLLETVEDAIRRLILPELNALKREQSKRGDRRGSGSISSGTTISRDEYASEGRQSGDKYLSKSKENLLKSKDRRDREARHELVESPAPSMSHESIDESVQEIEQIPHRSSDKLKAAAAGAALGGLAAATLNDKSPAIAREQRRRRRAEAKGGRASDRYSEEQDDLLQPAAPMPLMSEVNPSDITRTSILSADTERPHSASEELTPIQNVARGTPSLDSTNSSSNSLTPTRLSQPTLQTSLGTQHANISHGDLKTLPQRRTEGFDEEEYDEVEEFGKKVPIRPLDDYDDEEYEQGQQQYNDYYNTQDVPPPLKYVPYQPERRGLSPIPSVSGYTEGGSEVHNRDSRLTHRTSGSYSSPSKSIRHGGESPSIISRGSYQDDSVRSSGIDYRNTTYTDDSELDRVTSGEAVRAVGANPDLIHSPIGVESHVASLVDGSMLDESVLTGESGQGGQQYGHRKSMATLEEEASRGQLSSKHSADSHRFNQADAVSQASDHRSESRQSHEYDEYDIDEYGRKVLKSRYRQSPTLSEAAITSAAVGAAAVALKAAAQGKGKHPMVEQDKNDFMGEGVQRNKSFKDRAKKEGFLPANTPTHSVDRLVTEFEKPSVGHSGLPDLNDPMPEIGYFGHDDSRTNSSAMSDRLSASHEATKDRWNGAATPTQESVREQQSLHSQESGHSLTVDEAAGAAAIATAAALAHSHSLQVSQGQEDEWHRTSEDRKRDTIITNPYEGTSPVAHLPGLSVGFGQAQNFEDYAAGYGPRSPLGPKIDEGYISQGPNRTPDFKGKAIDHVHESMPGADDPFYTSNANKHLSGMSQGMASPLYDSAGGAGIDRIESKDIIALMQHLMVRDAQRSARDTEILVTLVRTASEMRNSFDDIKKMLADTEDVIITEVKDNTEKTVQRHIGGPRPFPGSAARSIQTGGSLAGTENDKKTRNLWKRALKGLSSKGVNDLTRIEDMLMQLLTEVDVLKTQTAPGGNGDESARSFDNIQPEIQYEQDRGYEPEGNAGTSTASHASQSGHLSLPRQQSGKLGYERQVSGHRISTVPEDNEDEYEDDNVVIHNHSNTNMLDADYGPQRGSSAPLGTPPHAAPAQASLSNENTPRTDKGRKHKSSGSSSWFPKISRWSETTASSVGKAFRNSRQSRDNDANSFRAPQSRSGSDLAGYEDYPVVDPYGDDKLHSGFSGVDLHRNDQLDPNQIQADDMQFTTAGISRTPIPPSQSPVQNQNPGHPHNLHPDSFMTPEDPKYKAHRNSLNLQHPQPRPGATEYFRNTLESSAQEFDTPASPKSNDWAGSATSLSRFPGHASRYSNGGDQYWGSSPAGGAQAPPRPPKEPIEEGQHRQTPPKSNRVSKLQKSSPLPFHSVESGYGTATHGATSASYSGSPKPENRNLSGALGVPARRPSGPRAMNSKSPVPSLGSSHREDDLRRRKRDTFGTVTSQDTDTF